MAIDPNDNRTIPFPEPIALSDEWEARILAFFPQHTKQSLAELSASEPMRICEMRGIIEDELSWAETSVNDRIRNKKRYDF